MTNLKSQQSRKDLIIYLAPQQYKPVGICTQEPIKSGIEIDEKKNNIDLYITPQGYECSSNEITLYFLQENNDAAECLGCVGGCVGDYGGDEDITEKIVSFINKARETHPTEAGDKLAVDLRLKNAAQWKADDFASNDYIGDVDHYGRTSADMLRAFGVPFLSQAENRIEITITDEDMPTAEEITEKVANEWMNDSQQRKNLMNADYTAIGVGFAKKETKTDDEHTQIKIYIAAEFAKIDKVYEGKVDKPELKCMGKCVKMIKWQQEYKEVTRWDGLQTITEKEPLPYIDMFIEIPRHLMCAIDMVELKFEVSPCKAFLEAKPKKEKIPEDNALRYTFEDDLVDGVWKVRWHLDNLTCLIPGEWIAAYAYLRGYDGCNPLLIGWNWFETPCWTSGIVQGCGLLDENGNVVDGGYMEDFKNEYVGDDRLHWLVKFKGKLFWVKPSDFAKYEIGDRVFIQKDGLSQYKDEYNNLEQEPACRYPFMYGGKKGDTVLSDSDVDYTLDKDKDIIVPQTFWGVGG